MDKVCSVLIVTRLVDKCFARLSFAYKSRFSVDLPSKLQVSSQNVSN